MSILSRILNLFREGKLDAEIHEELEFHINARTKDNVAAGMSSNEARLDALRRFGGTFVARENTRDVNILTWLDTIRQDILYACRTLRRNPGVTAVALISLAIGIGANTAIFSVVNAVMIRAFPYRDADRIAIVWGTNFAPGRLLHTSFPNYQDLRSQNRVFEEMALYRASDGPVINASGREGQPEWIEYAWVSDNFFRLLDRSPILGRVFSLDEFARGERVALLSYRLWQRRFAGSPAVIGQLLECIEC